MLRLAEPEAPDMATLVEVESKGTTTQVVLNRPERRNALDLETLHQLRAAIATTARDTAVHVIILHGRGECFCSGADLDDLAALSASDNPSQSFAPAVATLQEIVHDLATAPKVTIAAMHGAVLGAGLDLALACDLRIAAVGTQIACSYVRYGLVPDGGATWALPRLIGMGPALAMLLSGDPVDAEGAYRLGLLHRRVARGTHLEEAKRWAQELSQRSLPAQTAVKRLARVDPRLTLSAALKEEWDAQRRLLDEREPFRFLPAPEN